MSSDGGGSNVIVDLGEYIGERNETGERHGVGKAQLPNGDMYDGRYKYGRRNGPGTYFFIKNNAKYKGDYKDGEKHGHGLMIYPDGSRYEGTWDHNKRQGYGTYYYVNGDKYEGEWMNDIKHGQGTYDYNHCQSQFKGMWNMGKQEGMGSVQFPDVQFQGCFHSGQPDGAGIFLFKPGYEQKGEYIVEEKDEVFEDERFVYRTKQWICHGGITSVEPTKQT